MDEERPLIDRAVQGDEDALADLAATHRPTILRTAYHLLGDREVAEDVTQDVLVRLQIALPGFRQESDLGTWLYRVTLNLCRDHMRTHARRQYVPLAGVQGQLSSSDEPHERMERDRQRTAVREAIERLPSDQREAVSLRFLADLSYAEISRVTGAPHGTIASRVFRALKRLGADLAHTHPEILP